MMRIVCIVAYVLVASLVDSSVRLAKAIHYITVLKTKCVRKSGC